MKEIGFNLIIPQKTTRKPNENQSPSTIDYFFINNTAQNLTSPKLDVVQQTPKDLSDHNLLILYLKITDQNLKLKKTDIYTINKKQIENKASRYVM